MSNSLSGSSSFDSARFRSALSQFATGVTVIAARLPDGRQLGLTANSFNSVSLDPPLVLWSLARKSSNYDALVACSHYVINVLSGDQADLAEQFSRRGIDRFQGVPFENSPRGQPILRNVSAWFECENQQRHPGGDHTIFLGHVERFNLSPRKGLVLHGGRLVGV